MAQDYSALLRETVPLLAGVAGAPTVSLLPEGGGAAVSVADAIWQPTRTEAPRYGEDQVVASRGTLTIDPADAPGLGVNWRITVNGATYAIENLAHRAPLLDLELVRIVQSEIAQDVHRVRR